MSDSAEVFELSTEQKLAIRELQVQRFQMILKIKEMEAMLSSARSTVDAIEQDLAALIRDTLGSDQLTISNDLSVKRVA